jgi:iron complex outermembrane receptor protein
LALSAGAAALVDRAAALAAPPGPAQRLEIVGNRPTDAEERRRSTAAKIIIGREEIDKYGDSSAGELLKRLPGVTVQGAPGRGGQIRMRGLGNGYTQILLDGERVQGGLSLDSISPDQIERIEIIRAPTAETGARAIAGTINIITRGGYTRRLNEVRLAAGLENGRLQPNASWTRDDKIAGVDVNFALTANRNDRADHSTVETVNPTDDRTEALSSRERRHTLHATGRVQWRAESGSTLMLMPLMIFSQGESWGQSAFEPGAEGALPYSRSEGHNDNRFSLARLNSQWRAALGAGRLELRGGLGQAQSHNHALRTEFDELTPVDGGPAPVNFFYDDRTDTRETTLTLNAKHSLLMENDHSLVSGIELDRAEREESHAQLVNGQPALVGFGDDLHARSLRAALFAQDDWNLSPKWSAEAGLRWEGIATEGMGGDGVERRNQSSVWTPLMHAVWKPEPKSQDQVRISLTRSYRSPTLGNLIGSTRLSKGVNSPTNPDRTGNPELRPELATGIDLAYERYLPGGGMLSANVFRRQIEQLMRTVTVAQAQPDGSTRYVAQPLNVGNATTQGLELEAKFRLTEVWAQAPALDVRANASLFNSKVAQVPGPNNRLDQQPAGTANLGADYKLPGLPWTLGSSLNWTPAYATRLSDTQTLTQNVKRVIEAYALWQIDPTQRLRLSASNLAPQGMDSRSTVGDETATTLAQTFVSWRLQWEAKL